MRSVQEVTRDHSLEIIQVAIERNGADNCFANFFERNLSVTTNASFGDRGWKRPRARTGQQLCAGLCQLFVEIDNFPHVMLRSWKLPLQPGGLSKTGVGKQAAVHDFDHWQQSFQAR